MLPATPDHTPPFSRLPLYLLSDVKQIAEDRNRVYVFRSDMPADTDVYETSERVKSVKVICSRRGRTLVEWRFQSCSNRLCIVRQDTDPPRAPLGGTLPASPTEGYMISCSAGAYNKEETTVEGLSRP